MILNRLSILEDSINALNINREATKPAGTATNTLSNSIDNSNNQRSSEELWSSVLLKNIPAAGVCPVAESEDVFTSTKIEVHMVPRAMKTMVAHWQRRSI